MGIKRTRRRLSIIATIFASALFSFANGTILAQENHQRQPVEITDQQSQASDQQEPIEGYPVRMRRIGTPMDVEYDLDNSFPKSGSLLEMILGCEGSRQP